MPEKSSRICLSLGGAPNVFLSSLACRKWCSGVAIAFAQRQIIRKKTKSETIIVIMRLLFSLVEGSISGERGHIVGFDLFGVIY